MPSASIPLFPDTSTPLRLPLHKFRDTSALLRLVELHCIYGYKLSLTATLSLSPTPPASLRCRPASVPLSTRNLRLLFRLVDAVPLLSVLRSARAASLHVPPTHRGCCPCHSVRRLHSSSATHSPTPPSSAPQAPMGDTPIHSLHYGRRPTAYVNFEWPTAHGAEGSANSQTASGF